MTNIVTEIDTGTGLQGGPIIGGSGVISLMDMVNPVSGTWDVPLFDIEDLGFISNISSIGFNDLTQNILMMGHDCGSSNINMNNLVGFGDGVFQSATFAVDSCMFGFSAGPSISTGSLNNFFGSNAGSSCSTGNSNILIGRIAGNALIDDDNIIAFGDGAYSNTSGSSKTSNVAFGSLSLSLSNGNFNTAVGYGSGMGIVGDSNVFLGTASGSTQTYYTNCTFVGYNADATSDGLTNSTAIGANTTVSTSNSVSIGNSCAVGIGTSSPRYTCDVRNTSNFNPVVGLYSYKGQDAPTPSSGCVLYSRQDGIDPTHYSIRVKYQNGVVRTLSSHYI